MNYLKILLYFVFHCLLIGNVFCQIEQLSLAKAIEEALNSNFDIRISKIEEQIAKNKNTWSDAGLYPSIDLGGNGNIDYSILGPSPNRFFSGNFGSNGLQGNIDLNWILFEGFKVSINKKKFDVLQELSSGNLAVAVENTIHAVTLAYYDLLVQQGKKELNSYLLKLSRDKLKYAHSKLKIGSLSTYDLLQFQTSFFKDSLNYVKHLSVLKTAMRKLNFLMNHPLEQELKPTQKLDKISLTKYEKDSLKNKLLSNNNSLKNQLLQQSLIQQDKKLAQTRLSPKFTLATGYSNSLGGFFNDTASIFGIKTGRSYIRLALTYRIFDSRKIARAYKNAQLSLIKEKLSYQKTKIDLLQNFNNTFNNYETSRIEYLTNSKLHEITKTNLKITSKKLDIGTITSFEYRAIKNEYLQTHITLLQAAYNFLKEQTNLVRLTGGFIR